MYIHLTFFITINQKKKLFFTTAMVVSALCIPITCWLQFLCVKSHLCFEIRSVKYQSYISLRVTIS